MCARTTTAADGDGGGPQHVRGRIARCHSHLQNHDCGHEDNRELDGWVCWPVFTVFLASVLSC